MTTLPTSWLRETRKELLAGGPDWPELISSAEGPILSYQNNPRAGDGLAAVLRRFDQDGRAYDLELAEGIVVPLDQVLVLLPRT
jgi:hypothetical protein